MITNPRTLRAMTKAGFIVWFGDVLERHWTGATIRRRWVEPGPKLQAWNSRFKYRGCEYQLHCVDGCFHPFVFKVGAPVPAFV